MHPFATDFASGAWHRSPSTGSPTPTGTRPRPRAAPCASPSSAAPGCARSWTRLDLISDTNGAELLIDDDRISRIRMRMNPGLTQYLKLGPYGDRVVGWGDAPAIVEVRSVSCDVLAADLERAA